MNEAETRAEYIGPKLKQAGWGEVEDSKVLREFHIIDGRIQIGRTRSKLEKELRNLMRKNYRFYLI